MATRNIVPRADDEGQLGKEGKRWAEVNATKINATKINGSPTTATPTAGAIPVADESGKLDLAWMKASTEPAPGAVPISDGTGKIAAGWVPMSGESISKADALALIIALS